MSNVSIIRLGEIGLHIMQSNQMEDGEWISFFKNLDEVKEALDDSNGFIYKLPEISQEIVQKRLTTALSNMINGVSEVSQDHSQKVNQVQDSSSVGFPMTQSFSRDSMPIMETDKGSFHHMRTWMLKLKEIYKHIEGFTEIFAMACLASKVDPTIDYISESKKKLINSHILQCSNDHIAKLSNQA